ncbi:hypothetical protein M5Y49_17490 [Escherichia coli]|nr:hypothetical protein [Escherichia coli]
MNSEQIQALKEKAECICGILENIAGYEPGDIDGDDVELRFETEDGFDTGCNVSIVEQCQKSADVIRSLLAERDADKALIAESVVLFETLRQRVAELEIIRASAEKLVRCKGRYHSEQNYRALAALFGVSAPDLPPLDSEARTLTVKLPHDITHVTNKYFEEGRDAVIEAIESQLAAAGITLVVGE